MVPFFVSLKKKEEIFCFIHLSLLFYLVAFIKSSFLLFSSLRRQIIGLVNVVNRSDFFFNQQCVILTTLIYMLQNKTQINCPLFFCFTSPALLY